MENLTGGPRNNLDAGPFSEKPDYISVKAFAGTMVTMLRDSRIGISSKLRERFSKVENIVPTGQTNISVQSLGIQISFEELEKKMHRTIRFKLPDGLLDVGALVLPQRNCDPGNLSLEHPNALILQDGTVVSMEVTKRQDRTSPRLQEVWGWTVWDFPSNHVFQEGTRIMFAEYPEKPLQIPHP